MGVDIVVIVSVNLEYILLLTRIVLFRFQNIADTTDHIRAHTPVAK